MAHLLCHVQKIYGMMTSSSGMDYVMASKDTVKLQKEELIASVWMKMTASICIWQCRNILKCTVFFALANTIIGGQHWRQLHKLIMISSIPQSHSTTDIELHDVDYSMTDDITSSESAHWTWRFIEDIVVLTCGSGSGSRLWPPQVAPSDCTGRCIMVVTNAAATFAYSKAARCCRQ